MGKPRGSKQKGIRHAIVPGKGKHLSFGHSPIDSNDTAQYSTESFTGEKNKKFQISDDENDDDAPEEISAKQNPDILRLKQMHEKLMTTSTKKQKLKRKFNKANSEFSADEEIDMKLLAAVAQTPQTQEAVCDDGLGINSRERQIEDNTW
eukprot:CAMPEP_0182427694 /NCGR_PEP_ID=MMETSP1167-20130531/18989_1 /TAXON_ID=2988 /ORGANISM="Mallomonas Sp, Strain CCMP3275" /LENGTH=149 /DNA_ID=CAMNT_0024610117 /DNA_START=47 /DNA_END=493 /DNA_ORIENTATION=+